MIKDACRITVFFCFSVQWGNFLTFIYHISYLYLKMHSLLLHMFKSESTFISSHLVYKLLAIIAWLFTFQCLTEIIDFLLYLKCIRHNIRMFPIEMNRYYGNNLSLHPAVSMVFHHECSAICCPSLWSCSLSFFHLQALFLNLKSSRLKLEELQSLLLQQEALFL